MFTDENELKLFLDEVEHIVVDELKIRSGIRSAWNLMGVGPRVEMLTSMRKRVRIAAQGKHTHEEAPSATAEPKAAGEENHSQVEQTTGQEEGQPGEPSKDTQLVGQSATMVITDEVAEISSKTFGAQIGTPKVKRGKV